MSSDRSHPQELVPRFDPELLQARWTLGGLKAEDLVCQALTVLQQGFSGVALQQLASLTNPTLSDLGTLPVRAFADMGLKPIDAQRAVDIIVARGGVFRNEIFSSLLNTFPSFSDRWRKYIEDWRGDPAGDYLNMAEFVHFVVEDLHEKGKLDHVRAVFQFMERQLQNANQETNELIALGFFETLQTFASHGPHGYAPYEPFLGPISSRIWAEIQRTWEGKSSLADVIRAERGLG